MPQDRTTREQWMIALAVSGVVQALNAPFCTSHDEVVEAVNADPFYIENVAKKVGELCSHMQIEDTITVLQESLKHTL